MSAFLRDYLIMDNSARQMLKCLLRLLLRRALLYRLLLDRPCLAAGLDQLVGALGGDRLDRVPCAQGGVRLALGHVGGGPAPPWGERLGAGRGGAPLLLGRGGRGGPRRGRRRP